MSITYRFSLDGVVITEPENLAAWDKLVTQIKRDESDLKGLLVSQDVELRFFGELYRRFKSKYFNDGICSESTFLIEQAFDEVNFTVLHEGIIKLRDVVLTDMLRGEAKSRVKDNSFYSRIYNNKSIKTNPKGGWSKNGEPIPALTDYTVEVFAPATGVSEGSRIMLSLYEVMEYLVLWMSDGEVTFRSDLLQTELQLMIQQGFVLRTNSDPSPYWEVSFSDIYKNLKGLRDLSYTIEYDALGNPVFRLELASYFYDKTLATDQNGNEIIFTDPETLETKVNTNELYSQLRLGSEVLADYPYLTYSESIRYNGFKKEDFYPLGQCNIDFTLDLVKSFAVSSNVTESLITDSANLEFDDEIVLIHVENLNVAAHTADAIGTNPEGTTPPQFYNMALRNSEVAPSYFGTFQGGLVAGFLNFTVNDFTALKQIATLHPFTSPHLIGDPPIDVFPVPYEGEIDPGNNFNLGTEFYTCPVTGYYTFNFRLLITLLGILPSPLVFFATVNAEITDNLGNTLAGQGAALTNGSNLPISVSKSIYRTAGDQVGTRISVPYFAGAGFGGNLVLRVDTDTKFSATASPSTGGVVEDYDPEDIRTVLMTFNYPILPQTFNSILQNMRGTYKIRLTVLNEEYSGWIEQMKYDHKSENANITLKTSINNINRINAVSKLPAYLFTFDMATTSDQIDSFTYDNGVSNVTMTVPLAQSETNIKSQILSAFGGAGISVNDIIIARVSLGGARFRYKITIVNPNFTMDVIDVSGNSTISSFYYY